MLNLWPVAMPGAYVITIARDRNYILCNQDLCKQDAQQELRPWLSLLKKNIIYNEQETIKSQI